ncbi:MAG: NADH/ubiquinone/plastoquinone (complex I) [Elusimicrobia bacterium]|nr:NADH/ubiquinone/plastoquinone (complex I) [Elusimicrobiota bacterium]
MSDGLLLALPVVLPGALFAAFGACWLLDARPSEKSAGRLTTACWGVVMLAVGALAARAASGAGGAPRAEYGDWLTAGGQHFTIALRADVLSLVMLSLSAVLIWIVAVFSRRYMHRDPGFHRFFTLLNLFGAGTMLLFAAESFELLAVGWEFVGAASVLLVAFYQEREAPARGALRVLAAYRLGDIGLFAGAALLHHHHGAPSGTAATAVGGLFLLAAMAKSAQAPFSGWLPRAMEGPTPSSAIFYGALSVHAGAYLLLRARPILDASARVPEAIIAVGALTALQGALVGRTCPDAKTSLAYATVTQLGLIFVEIGLGFDRLALWHIAGHAVLRTAQFLAAPSLLHDHHLLHSAAGGHLPAAGAPFARLIPRPLQDWLYGFALDLRGRGLS